MNKVLVIGSINMDFVVETDKFPVPGETVLGSAFKTFPGGKGANQAVAAQRLGAQVTMLGCVGNDDSGNAMLRHMKTEGINTDLVKVMEGVITGMAAITVSEGENSIIVVPGANHHVTPAHIAAAEEAFIAADVVLAQLEIPLPTVQAAARMAQRHQKPFLLNPAPAMPLPTDLIAQTTLLTPNEHELCIMLATDTADWQALLMHYPGKILMTHGAEGAYYTTSAGVLQCQKAFPVEVTDTTGAGDTFNGALAAFWGADMSDLARFACAAGALSVTKAGAQSGMPTYDALKAFLKDK